MAKPYTSPLSGLQICMEFFFLVFYTTYLVTVLTRRALPTILHGEPLSVSSSILLCELKSSKVQRFEPGTHLRQSGALTT